MFTQMSAVQGRMNVGRPKEWMTYNERAKERTTGVAKKWWVSRTKKLTMQSQKRESREREEETSSCLNKTNPMLFWDVGNVA